MYLKYLELALAGGEDATDLADKPVDLLDNKKEEEGQDKKKKTEGYWDILDESDEVLHHQ